MAQMAEPAPKTSLPPITDEPSAMNAIEDRDDNPDSAAVLAAVRAWARENGNPRVLKAVTIAAQLDKMTNKTDTD